MHPSASRRCIAFEGFRRIAAGDVLPVALQTKEVVDRGETAPVLLFDDATGDLVEVDLRGTPEEVRARLAAAAENDPPASEAAEDSTAEATPRGPGRPKLGVIAREVTLLPRHWDWLATQPGGASVALRKLVDEARQASAGADRIRRSQEATQRFLTALAGDLPGYEEATRALYARDAAKFAAETEAWPADVREQARSMAAGTFAE